MLNECINHIINIVENPKHERKSDGIKIRCTENTGNNIVMSLEGMRQTKIGSCVFNPVGSNNSHA